MGYSKQAYYQGLYRQQRWKLESSIILELVRDIRKDLSRYGGRKLLHDLRPDLEKMKISIGRDAFFDLLKQEGLLVEPKKKKRICTTDSKHPFKIHQNLLHPLLEGEGVQWVYQVLVADITYIRTLDGFLYLALLTDLYSRKIVGFDVSDSLELIGCKRALQMALKNISQKVLIYIQPIHHSDRGVQYCSYEYTDLLKLYHFQISMGRAGNCYDNAYAESVNGILKVEFNLETTFANKSVAIKACKQAILLYNSKRGHGSLNLQKPNDVFQHNLKQILEKID